MDRLTELFIRDSKKYTTQAVNSLINIEKNQDVESNIEAAFRAVHSIKTESSYLQMTETKNLSHEIENTLESFRSGETVPDEKECGRIITELDNLSMIIKRELEIHGAVEPVPDAENKNNLSSENIPSEIKAVSPKNETEDEYIFDDSINQSDIEKEEEYYILEYDLEGEDEGKVSQEISNTSDDNDAEKRQLENPPLHDDSSVINSSVSASGIAGSSDKNLPAPKEGIPEELREEVRKEFTDFELQLLSESMKRGEKLYRITCEISEDSVMKYPRLYLVINNLEIKTNLIKIYSGCR